MSHNSYLPANNVNSKQLASGQNEGAGGNSSNIDNGGNALDHVRLHSEGLSVTRDGVCEEKKVLVDCSGGRIRL
jgi:hypothetical protein